MLKNYTDCGEDIARFTGKILDENKNNLKTKKCWLRFLSRSIIAFCSTKLLFILQTNEKKSHYSHLLTIAKRLSQPSTFVGTLLNFWAKASDVLCAGSVEIINTLSLVFASWRAILQLNITQCNSVFISKIHVCTCSDESFNK